MTIRTITGNVIDIAGSDIPEATFSVIPESFAFGSDPNTVVFGDLKTVISDGNGDVSFDLHEGKYLGRISSSQGSKTFRLVVDSEGPWTLGRLIGELDTVTSSLAAQIFEARDDVLSALASIGSLSGWSPVLSVIEDNSRRVLQVEDWVGGEGSKPPTGDYIGSTGLVSDIVQAIDIRGPKGEKGDPGTGISILGSFEDPSELPVSGNEGDAYLIGGDLWVWDESDWLNVGNIQGPEGNKGDPGDDGWSPIFAVVSDGARRVLRIDDWTGGEGTKPATGDYVGSTGLVSDIAEAVDIRGPEGEKGDQGDQGDQGDPGGQGDPGDDGDNGWSPVLAIASDDDRRVVQIADWVGGEGSKPATGDYVGASGLTSDIAQAVNIRGPAGAGTGDMLASTYDPQGIEADAFDRGNHTGTQAAGTITGLATVATTGAYSDLSGTPSLATVATTGDYGDLDNLPSLFDGSYSSLTDVPLEFPPESHTHTVAQITDFPSLATVATTGAYSDLSGLPSLFDGSYFSLTDVPSTFVPSAHTHTLSDITNSGNAAALNVGTTAGTVAAGDHGHSNATDSAAGFMSATDKARLDGLEGGDEGQVLAKATDADFDFEWIEGGGGGGGGGLGDDQEWQDVSRSLGTVYQNTTGKPIAVSFFANNANNAAIQYIISTSSGSSPTPGTSFSPSASRMVVTGVVNAPNGVFGVIPDGWYYRYDTDGPGTINNSRFRELR